MALKQEFRLNKRILCLLLQEQRSALLIFSILSCRLQASARTVSSLWIIQLLHAQMSGTWAKSSYIVQFQAKKKKKRYGAEEGPLTDQEQCKCKTPSEWRVPKIAWSTLVHQESFSTCHRYKPQPCCQF